MSGGTGLDAFALPLAVDIGGNSIRSRQQLQIQQRSFADTGLNFTTVEPTHGKGYVRKIGALPVAKHQVYVVAGRRRAHVVPRFVANPATHPRNRGLWRADDIGSGRVVDLGSLIGLQRGTLQSGENSQQGRERTTP